MEFYSKHWGSQQWENCKESRPSPFRWRWQSGVALDQPWGNHSTGSLFTWQFVREHGSNPSWAFEGPSLGLFKLKLKGKDLSLFGIENEKMWVCRAVASLTSPTAFWEKEVNSERGKPRAEAGRQPWEYLSLWLLRPEITLKVSFMSQ